MESSEHILTKEEYANSIYYRKRRFVTITPLVVLLVSYYYCLPLGRFSVGGFDSDFRVFDFAIVFNFVYYLSNPSIAKEFSILSNATAWFVRWYKVLSILVVFSILIALMYSGSSFLLPTLIRAFRFVSYMMTAFLVFAVVRNKSDFIFFFQLTFWLMAGVGFIAFLQGLGLLPNFWPDYWRIMYSENDAPVATLSPHHKHIGVIMLTGVCIGIGNLMITRSVIVKIAIGVMCLIMFTVPLFSGTRTYMLGFVGVIPAILILGNSRAVIPIAVMVLGAYFFLQYSGDEITSRVENKFNERVTGRIEKLGYGGLYEERTVIYFDILRTITDKPYLLVTGTGFQNIQNFIAANGAHNNYLQALMELGIGGLFVFVSFLILLWKNLWRVMRVSRDKDIVIIAQYTWVAFCGVLVTMFVGETFWGQAAMFTLAGQLSFLFSLAVTPLYWLKRYASAYVPREEMNRDEEVVASK
ncbi:MAG: O-antigen ligase family protein [Chryseolinea sp.]